MYREVSTVTKCWSRFNKKKSATTSHNAAGKESSIISQKIY